MTYVSFFLEFGLTIYLTHNIIIVRKRTAMTIIRMAFLFEDVIGKIIGNTFSLLLLSFEKKS